MCGLGRLVSRPLLELMGLAPCHHMQNAASAISTVKALAFGVLDIHMKTLIFLRQIPLMPFVRKCLLPTGGNMSLEEF